MSFLGAEIGGRVEVRVKRLICSSAEDVARMRFWRAFVEGGEIASARMGEV